MNNDDTTTTTNEWDSEAGICPVCDGQLKITNDGDDTIYCTEEYCDYEC